MMILNFWIRVKWSSKSREPIDAVPYNIVLNMINYSRTVFLCQRSAVCRSYTEVGKCCVYTVGPYSFSPYSHKFKVPCVKQQCSL